MSSGSDLEDSEQHIEGDKHATEQDTKKDHTQEQQLHPQPEKSQGVVDATAPEKAQRSHTEAPYRYMASNQETTSAID